MITQCRACSASATFAFRATDRNRRISKSAFDYYRCSACGLIFLADIPGDLDRYYPANYYSIPRSTQHLAAAAGREQYKLDIVRKFSSGGRLLEIGPAYGSFAYLAKHAGYDTEVIEMSPDCCRFLKDVIGVRTIQSDDPGMAIRNLPPFDVIALWHVIEHLADPWDLLAATSNKLRPGGILVLAAPNPSALQFRIMGRFWPHVDAPRHVALIPDTLLTSKLQAMGLQRVWITTNDAGSRGWNIFGWEYSFANLTTHRYLKFGLRIVGKIFGVLMGPCERAEGKGSAYTVVYRKEPSRS